MHITLRQANNTLFTLIVIINVYIIAAPFLPQVQYWWQMHHTNKQEQLTSLARTPASTTVNKPNSLVIPAMLLDAQTLEGPKNDWYNILKNGVWRWPESSTPDKGGNTVFLAHRFSYTGPRGAFYYLNKLKIGDEIAVVWNNKTYKYRVSSTREVSPNETSIQDNTNDARITLFTCTPLWHPVNRLVVVAELEQN